MVFSYSLKDCRLEQVFVQEFEQQVNQQ